MDFPFLSLFAKIATTQMKASVFTNALIIATIIKVPIIIIS